MSQEIHIILIDDDEVQRTLFTDLCGFLGYIVLSFPNLDKLQVAVDQGEIDPQAKYGYLIFCDALFDTNALDGRDALKAFQYVEKTFTVFRTILRTSLTPFPEVPADFYIHPVDGLSSLKTVLSKAQEELDQKKPRST